MGTTIATSSGCWEGQMWVEHWAVWGTKGLMLDCPPAGRPRKAADQERQLLAYGRRVSWPKVGNKLMPN